MINLSLVGEKELVLHLRSMPAVVRTVIEAKIYALTLKLEARVKEKLSGQVLKVRSGALRRSIASKVTAVQNAIEGKVFSSGDVKYARIHELGGKTKPHVIEAKNGKALAFGAFVGMGAARSSWGLFETMMILKKVNHPGSVIPQRSYLGSSLKEQATDIVQGLKLAAIEGARLALQGGTA